MKEYKKFNPPHQIPKNVQRYNLTPNGDEWIGILENGKEIVSGYYVSKMGEIISPEQYAALDLDWALDRDIDGWHWDRGFLRIKRELMDDTCPTEKIYCYDLYRVHNRGQQFENETHVWQFPDLPTAKRVGNILLTT